jgi:hypothetical protein
MKTAVLAIFIALFCALSPAVFAEDATRLLEHILTPATPSVESPAAPVAPEAEKPSLPSAPAPTVETAAPAVPPPPPDPCEAYKTYGAYYTVCQDRMGKIKRMMDAQTERQNAGKPAVPAAPPASVPDSAVKPAENAAAAVKK